MPGKPSVAEGLGRVVAALPGGGEARAGQMAMAEAVAAAIESDRHLVVRAGTGTGKSLAYLVPAILSGKRVLVATATKALQDQLAAKDLPGLASRLGRPVSWAVLKGRSNYLCVQRLHESELGSQQELAGDLGGPGESLRAEQARRIATWAERTKTGDRAELEIEPDPKLWSAFSVSAEECPGSFRCPSGSQCFAESARARAAGAQVVVVNLHLLGAHLASEGAVLPEVDAIVVDEAHELEDVLSSSLGVSVGPSRLRAVAASARSALGVAGRPSATDEAAVDAIFGVADQLESALATQAGVRLRAGALGEIGEVVSLAGVRLERLEHLLGRAAERGRDSAAGSLPGTGGLGGDDPDGGAQRVMRAVLSLSRCRGDLARLAAVGDAEVAWVEGGPRPSIEIAPIDVADTLAEGLFATTPVVLTSATVPLGLAVHLGADPAESDALDVGSPFDYDSQALLYCAAHLPDRRRPEAEEALHAELAALIGAAGGRTLALFTSWAAMTRAATALRAVAACPILAQGEAGKPALVTAFCAEPAACLFATMGFWQGLDVPGPTLSLVVIDRIPFPRPDEPLIAARRERAGPSAFREIDLPRAAGMLAQGAGRLIRTASDRGVVAVLDSRLATASYRWDLVRAMPPFRRTKDRQVAFEFLQRLHEEASAVEAAQVRQRDAAPSGGSRRRSTRASVGAPAPRVT
jgi:ATP-dependent DNA helicase DinG